MKKTVNLIVTMLIICISIPMYGAPKDSNKQIRIKGHVVNTVDPVKNFELKVYEKGQLIYKTKSDNGKFDYTIPLNAEVMLEFSAEDHYTKRIAFASVLVANEDLKKLPTMVLEVNLISESRYPELEEVEDLLDLPVAFITHDAKGNYYDLNKKQSGVLYKELMKEMREGTALNR